MAIRHIRKHMAYSPTPLDQHFIYAFGFWASISSGEPLILGARNEWRDSGRTAEDFANRPASTPCGLTSETAEGMVQFPGGLPGSVEALRLKARQDDTRITCHPGAHRTIRCRGIANVGDYRRGGPSSERLGRVDGRRRARQDFQAPDAVIWRLSPAGSCSLSNSECSQSSWDS